VDNASTDGSGEKLSGLFPDITVIRNKENRGFCGGNNDGIRWALEHQFEFILLINDDATADSNMIEKFVQKSRELGGSENPFVLTGKIYTSETKELVWYAGGYLSYIHGIGKQIGFFKPDQATYNIPAEISYVNGCLLFASQIVFKKIGLLNEKFFAYLEDTEYSFRLKKAGVTIYYLPEAIAFHTSNAGAGIANYSALYHYYSTRNRLWVHTSLLYRCYLVIYTSIISFVKLLVIFAKSQKKAELSHSIITGLTHGVFKKRTRCGRCF